MLLSRLATVELQLVMHGCDQQSLLALAQCSHFTFAAASHPFAWRHASPVVIGAARLIAAVLPPSPLQRVYQFLRCTCCCPSESGRAQSHSQLNCASPWSLLRHADQLLRWNGSCPHVDTSQWSGVDTIRSLLAALPRLVAFELPDWRFSSIRWTDVEACLPALGQLTALDISAQHMAAQHIRALVRMMPRLHVLRYRASGSVRECLQLLAELPQLTDLRLSSARLEGDKLDFVPIAACCSLRRLTFDAVYYGIFEPLLAPGLRHLRELTLAHLASDAPRVQHDWAAALANLQSLRRLTVDRCGCVTAILTAVVESAGPHLRLLRVAPAVLHIINSPWSHAVRPNYHMHNPSPAAISALLERCPEIRIELRIGFRFAGVSASWLLPLRSQCDWRTAVPQWTHFQPLHPLRHKFRDRPFLFPDSELGRERHEE